jgi:hypothetical protein
MVNMGTKGKPMYVYGMDGKLEYEFETTQDCADFFEKDKDYINHNVKYCKKIRRDGVWYSLSREKKESKG